MKTILLAFTLTFLCGCTTHFDRSPVQVPIFVPIQIPIPQQGPYTMLFRPVFAADLSGSVGGLTASHNAGGPYFRVRSIPTDPGTPFQLTMRNGMTVLQSAWNDDLTEVQRDAWRQYAANVTLTNRIGEQRNVSGGNMYSRGNLVALQVGLPRQDDGPPIFNLGSFTEPVLEDAKQATQDIGLSFNSSDAWAQETGSVMVVYISKAQNESIVFFKGPYRFAGTVDGDDSVPPPSPQRFTVPFTIEIGQRIFVKIRVCRRDGRLSGTFRTSVLVIA